MRNQVLYILLYSVFVIVFNLFFFLLGEMPHPASVWISYGFIHLAYGLLVATPLFSRRGRSAALFGVTVSSISAVYFALAFVAGLVFIFLAPEEWRTPFLVQVVIAGIYTIIFIINLLANDATADAETERQHEIEFIKRAAERLKNLMARTKDKEVKLKIEQAYDTVYSSPVKTHPSLSQMEIRLLTLLGELEEATARGNQEETIALAESLKLSVIERNSRLKTLSNA